MRGLSFVQKKGEPLKALFLGAHSDDIELGCGGTILSLLEQGQELEAWWVVFAASLERRDEAEKGAEMFLRGVVKKEIIVRDFKESFFPYRGEAIKSCFEELKVRIDPDLIFTHYRHDLHQDHRVISDFTWNTWRNHFILEYEIPKYDGDLAAPNTFVPLSETIARSKAGLLLECFKTQRNKQWFSGDTFLSLMCLRGVECNASSKYAEGYYSRKTVLQF